MPSTSEELREKFFGYDDDGQLVDDGIGKAEQIIKDNGVNPIDNNSTTSNLFANWKMVEKATHFTDGTPTDVSVVEQTYWNITATTVCRDVYSIVSCDASNYSNSKLIVSIDTFRVITINEHNLILKKNMSAIAYKTYTFTK